MYMDEYAHMGSLMHVFFSFSLKVQKNVTAREEGITGEDLPFCLKQ